MLNVCVNTHLLLTICSIYFGCTTSIITYLWKISQHKDVQFILLCLLLFFIFSISFFLPLSSLHQLFGLCNAQLNVRLFHLLASHLLILLHTYMPHESSPPSFPFTSNTFDVILKSVMMNEK